MKNNKNSQNSNSENIDQAKENLDIYTKAQRKYIEENLKKDINFFDDFENSKLFTDFFSFINFSDKFSDLALKLSSYGDSEKKGIINKLQGEISKITIPRKNNLNKLTKSFISEYDLKPAQKNNLEKFVNKVGNGDLISLLNSSSKRFDFISKHKIFGKEDVLNYKKDIKTKIEKELNLDLSDFSDEQKETIFKVFNSTSTICLDDLKLILPGLTDNISKINFINYFLDYVSYDDLDKNNLLPDSDKEKIKNKFIADGSKYLKGLSDSEKERVFNSVNKKEFLLDINSLSVNFLNLLNDDNFLDKIINSYNSEIDIDIKSRGSILNKLTPIGEKQDINDSFIEYVSSDESMSNLIKNGINKFQKGNIVELVNKSDTGDNNVTYYYIKEVDHGSTAETKRIIFTDISNPAGGFNKDLTGDDEIYTYDKFYNLLKGISNPENKQYSLKFSDKDSLKDKEIVEDDNISSVEELKNKLDLIDSEGKDIKFSKDEMVLELNGDDNFVFLIDSINGTNITINQGSKGNITVSFNEFYNIFSEGNLKRKKKINNFEDLKNNLSASGNNNLDSLEIGGNDKDKLILKDDRGEKSNSKNYSGVKLFVGSDGDALYINEISENNIVYTKGKIDKKEEKFKKSSDGYTSRNFSQFLSDINKYSLEPKFDNIDGDHISDKELQGEKEMHGSFFSRMMNKMSFAEVIAGLKFLPDTIQKNLERGNKLKSYKLAEKIAGLTGKDSSFYLSMKTAKEQEEKSLIEEMTNNLKALGSKDMVNKIEGILLNLDSGEEELISALMTIVGKYGVLYPKTLKGHAGKFLWYKRLGGTEEFRRKHEAELKNNKSPSGKPEPVFFTEERLIESWLGKRGKEGTIRSKLDKDYGNALASGLKDEMEDGDMKCGNKVTTSGRVDYFVSQLAGLEYANATGSIEKVFGKNASAMEMQTIPFVLTMSGLAKNFDQVLLNKIIGFSFSTPFTGLFFNKDTNSIDLFQTYIEEVIKDKFGENSKMYGDFSKIKGLFGTDKSVYKIYDFWKEYGEELVGFVNLSDPYTILKRQENPIYDKYFNFLKGTHSSGEFGAKTDDVIAGVYDSNPVAYTSGLLSFVAPDQSGALGREENENAYHMYINSIKKFRDYNVENVGLDRNSQKRNFEEIFWPFAHRVSEKAGKYSGGSGAFLNIFRKEFGVPIYDEDKHGSKDSYLDLVFDDFMNYKKDSSSSTQNEIKTKFSDIMDIDLEMNKKTKT